MSIKWTENQRIAATVADRNLIVSAGAGAGKTATLVERVFRLLCDEANRCKIDEMLIVTFSRAAAQEMRGRLAKRLAESAIDPANPPSLREHLQEQAFLLPRASISTIHSFCLQLIMAHPERAGLAPGFELMTEEEARLFAKDFIRARIEHSLQSEDAAAPVILRILDEFDPLRGVEDLVRIASSCHHFLSAIPDHEELKKRCGELANADADHAVLKELISEYLRSALASVRRTISRAARFSARSLHPKLAPHAEHIQRLAQVLDADDPGLQIETILALSEFPRFASRFEKSPVDEAFQREWDLSRKAWKSLCEKISFLSPSTLATDLSCAAQTLTGFVCELGVKWFGELFDAHIQRRRLTFSHLERLALRILYDADGTPSEVARFYRDNLKYVLVDEFQDVNELQDRILRAIARPASTRFGGNLFLVGDVKQSIYEFRLADPSLFLRTYSNSKTLPGDFPASLDARVNLTENFRSAPELLSEFNTIFCDLFQLGTVGLDYAGEQQFKPGRTMQGESGREPKFHLEMLPPAQSLEADGEDSTATEALHIASLVHRLGPPWKDICILLRSTVGSARELVQALNAYDIPVFTESRLGFLTAVEVIEFQALLRAIYNPYDDVALLGCLRGPACGWNEEEILRLRIVNRQAFLYHNLIEASEQVENPIHSKAQVFLRRHQGWQERSLHLPMADFFSWLFQDLHLLERAAVRPNGDQRRLNLLHMLDRARLFDSFSHKGLGEFLRFLEDLIENDEDFAPPSPLAAEADVVRIMTVHASKGMEFPVVILPFTGKQFNHRGSTGVALFDRTVGAALKVRDAEREGDGPPPLYRLLQEQRRRKELCEELRLLYVALTRAQESVYVVGTCEDALEIYEEERAASDGNGLLPPEIVFSAKRPCEWLIRCAARRLRVPAAGRVDLHAEDGIYSLAIASAEEASAVLGAVRRELENRGSSVPAPSADEMKELEEAIARVEELSRRTATDRLRAKLSVTEAKRAFDASRDAASPHFRVPAGEAEADPWWPASLREEQRGATGTQRGTAMHRFLANCSFDLLASGDTALDEELLRLRAEGLLTQQQAEMVDLETLEWFFNSPLGRRALSRLTHLHRERAFSVRVESGEIAADAPEDFVVLHGVADLLFREKDGWVLVDYKTDYTGRQRERLGALTTFYETQMKLYRLLLERTLGEPVKEAWLVFLQAREAVPVAGADSFGQVAWQHIIEAGAIVAGTGEPARREVEYRGV